MPPKDVTNWGKPSKVGVLIDGEWHEVEITDEPTVEIEPIDVFSELIWNKPQTLHFSFRLSRKQALKVQQTLGYKKPPKFTYKTNKNYFKR